MGSSVSSTLGTIRKMAVLRSWAGDDISVVPVPARAIAQCDAFQKSNMSKTVACRPSRPERRWRPGGLSSWQKIGRKPGYREAIEAQYLRYLDVISRRSGSFGGGGGSFGGGGATGTWDEPASVLADAASTPLAKPSPPQLPAGDPASAGASRSGVAAVEPRRKVVCNGYTYEIDSRERTRRVSGMLSSTATPVRSRTSQTQAGGADRRVSDDGGHYIAARFRGPTEAFNHFAQDANFNRGGYRVLEDEWARDKRAGRSVTVTIVPRFDDQSVRPSTINVWWTVDGKGKSVRFPNERSEKRLGGN